MIYHICERNKLTLTYKIINKIKEKMFKIHKKNSLMNFNNIFHERVKINDKGKKKKKCGFI